MSEEAVLQVTKRIRQKALVDIVERQQVLSQIGLVKEMQKRGLKVTQATVSRDVQELNLVKSKWGYRKLEDVSPGAGATIVDPLGTLRSSINKVDMTPNMLVVRTAAGFARAVAMVLDAGSFGEAVGTVAGDDTVFVATRSPEETVALKKKILQVMK